MFDAGLDVDVGIGDELMEGGGVRVNVGEKFYVAHVLAGADEEARRVGQVGAVEESDVEKQRGPAGAGPLWVGVVRR